MAVTKISSSWVYTILYIKGKVIFYPFFFFSMKVARCNAHRSWGKICCSLPLVTAPHFIDSALFKPKYFKKVLYHYNSFVWGILQIPLRFKLLINNIFVLG